MKKIRVVPSDWSGGFLPYAYPRPPLVTRSCVAHLRGRLMLAFAGPGGPKRYSAEHPCPACWGEGGRCRVCHGLGVHVLFGRLVEGG